MVLSGSFHVSFRTPPDPPSLSAVRTGTIDWSTDVQVPGATARCCVPCSFRPNGTRHDLLPLKGDERGESALKATFAAFRCFWATKEGSHGPLSKLLDEDTQVRMLYFSYFANCQVV